MKKIIYSLILFMAFGFACVSCSDDDDDAAAPSGNAASVAAGTYTGTWTRILDSDTLTAEGTMIVSATDSAYTADIAYACSTFNLNTSSVANFAYSGASGSLFDYSNGSTSNGMGTIFCGKITDGVATAIFSYTQKSGRKSYTYKYSFVGTKSE